MVGGTLCLELLDLYSFPGIVLVIKSRRIRWVGYVVRMGEERNACLVLEGGGHLK